MGGKDGPPCPSTSKGDTGAWSHQGWAHTGVPSVVWLLPLCSPALTRTPDIYIKEPLESGSSSHVTCSVPGACDQATPPTISWTGAALHPPGLDSKGAYNSSEILLTPGPQDHGTNLTCQVTFRRAGVSTERTVMLNVSCERGIRMAGCSRGGESAPVTRRPGAGRVCRKDVGPVLLCFQFCASWGVGGAEGSALTLFLTASLCPRRPPEPDHQHLPRKWHR